MIISKVGLNAIFNALDDINHIYYDGNIRFRENTPQVMSGSGLRHRVLLAVHDSDGPGAIRTVYKGWRTRYACWHVHGNFFACLPSQARIFSHGRRFYADDPWEDWNAGNMFNPIMQSQRCLCNSQDGTLKFVPLDKALHPFGDPMDVVYDHEKLELELLQQEKQRLVDELKKREETVDDVYMRLMEKRINNFK